MQSYGNISSLENCYSYCLKVYYDYIVRDIYLFDIVSKQVHSLAYLFPGAMCFDANMAAVILCSVYVHKRLIWQTNTLTQKQQQLKAILFHIFRGRYIKMNTLM